MFLQADIFERELIFVDKEGIATLENGIATIEKEASESIKARIKEYLPPFRAEIIPITIAPGYHISDKRDLAIGEWDIWTPGPRKDYWVMTLPKVGYHNAELEYGEFTERFSVKGLELILRYIPDVALPDGWIGEKPGDQVCLRTEVTAKLMNRFYEFAVEMTFDDYNNYKTSAPNAELKNE
jgi:hypothetical protein